MRKLLLPGGAALIATAALVTWPLIAADHQDSPQATNNPTADVDDVFAWMTPGADNVNMVMTIGRDVAPGFQFSDSVAYTFRVTSQPTFGSENVTTTDVVCTFDTNQNATCNVGDVQVSGDASSEVGLMSSNGQLRVFAGQRNDPFFFNFSGFRATAETVANAAPNLQFDDEGCPMLDAQTSNALVTQLQQEPNGDPAEDDFADQNVLALVLQMDKTLVNAGGDILGVSAFTNNGG